MNKYEEFLKELTELSRRTGVTVWACGCCNGINLSDDALPEGHYLYSNKEMNFDSIEFSLLRCTAHPPDSAACGLCEKHPGVRNVEEFNESWGREALKSTRDLKE